MAGLNKLRQLRDLVKLHQVTEVIFTGDFFNIRDQSWDYWNQVANILRQIEANVFSIVGNHDIPYERLDLLNKTPLAGLFQSCLTQLQREKFNDWEIVGQSIGELPSHKFQKSTQKKSIFVLHAFYQKQFEDEHFITPEEINSLGYKYLVLGHDHVSYPPMQVPGGDTILIRPGSLMRGTSHYYQLQKEVNVYILDLTTERLERVKIKTQPASEVFSRQAMDKNIQEKLSMKKASELVGQLMRQMEDQKNSVYKILDGLRLEPDVSSYLEIKLRERGIFRT
jgi:DNA repair exonuclease SbcCD nuclease subunit